MKKLFLVMALAMVGMVTRAQININLETQRTSGVAPLAVFFDAWGTTATGVTYPFHELFYEWDFDDPTSGSWALTGKSKNVAYGPKVAHVFDESGTYTVTLTVKDENGNTDTETVTINVSDPDTYYSGTNTICFSTSGNFNGAPAGSQQVTTSSFNTAIGYSGTNKRLLFKRGETFSSSNSATASSSGITIGAFGEGTSKPRINANHTKTILSLLTDARVMDLEFQGSGQSGSNMFGTSGRMNNVLVYNTKAVPGTLHAGFVASGNALDAINEDIHMGVFIVDNDWQDFGFGTGGNIIFITAGNLAIMGNHLEDVTGGEHIIRIQHVEEGFVSNNFFAKQHATKALLTIRNRPQNETCSAGCGRDTREVVVSDNIFIQNTDLSLTFVEKNNSAHTVHGHDIIAERNYLTNYSGTGQVSINSKSYAENVTIRNNILNMDNQVTYRGIESYSSNTWVYNNSAYTDDNPSLEVRCVRIRGGSNTSAYNNLLYAPNASITEVVEGGTYKSNNIDASSNPFITTSIDGPEDYQLHGSSAAIDAGVDVPVYIDYAFAARPAGGAYDVGAYEYGGTVADYLNASPAALTFPMAAGNQGITVSSNVDWAASDDQSWISLSPASGSGNGTITVTVTEYTGTGTREGTVTVTDGIIVKTIDIVQEGQIAVTGVELDQSSLALNEGQSAQLQETVTPSNATDPSVSWSSSDTLVATVGNNGLVTAVGTGSATITVTTNDGGLTDDCAVTVQVSGYPYDIVAVTSSEAGSTPELSLDGDFEAGWSTDVLGAWVKYELSETKNLASVDIVFKPQNDRAYSLVIETSTDDVNWTELFNGQTSAITVLDWESFDITDTDAQYVRLTGNGNTENNWNVYREVRLNYATGDTSTVSGLMPYIDGNWWQIASTPTNLPPQYDSPSLEPVDFSVWQAADGTWQAVSCIRNCGPGEDIRILYRWESSDFTSSNWTAMGVFMTADPSVSEEDGWVQAPHVIKEGSTYRMYYGGGGQICLAESSDGKNFTRVLNNGLSQLFVCDELDRARDPMVMKSNGQYYIYYTGHTYPTPGAAFSRTSTDMLNWGSETKVAQGGVAGSEYSSAECPFTIEINNNYYFFRTQNYINQQTTVYRSPDPLYFGINDDQHRLGTMAIAAPEIIEYQGELYMASLVPGLTGIRIAKLEFPEETIDFDSLSITDYTTDPQNGSAVANGTALAISGNAWKKIDFPYTITPNTVLRFDINASDAGEILGIGFDDDNDQNNSAYIFQVAGSQTTWSGTLKDYTYTGGTQSFEINVGSHYTGGMDYMVFVLDDDADASGNAIFDNVYVYEASGTVAVTGVTLDQSSLTLDEGQSADLAETVIPGNASDQSVNWSSNDSSVATVSTSGLVTAIAEGSATITVTTNDGGYTAQCSVTVNEATAIPGTMVWEDDYDGIDWRDGDNDGVNEWHSYIANTPGCDWSIIDKSQAQSEGVDVSGVVGNKLYKAEITGTDAASHRAYPSTHLDEEGNGEQPGYPNGVPSAFVNQWYVWWDPEGIDLSGGKWMHFATWCNNPDWQVTTLTAVDGGSEPYILDIQGGNKVKDVQYHANRAVPTQQWIRFTAYIDYGYDNGGGTDNDGIVAVWMNGTLIATGTGNNLDPDYPANGSTYLKRAHWGLYASGNCDRGLWYEDVNKLWTLDNPLNGFSSEPMPPDISIVPVTGVTLDQSSLTLDEGQSAGLTETVSPSEATNQSVSWSSNDSSIATVSTSGLVTAIAEGSATITVTTNDGGFTDQCSVTVNPTGGGEPVEIIMDNTSTGVSFSGTTWDATAGSNYYGSNFRVIDNGSSNTIRWTPDLSGTAGEYEIFVWYATGWVHLGTDAPYTVSHDGGISTVDVDQTQNGGQWVSIGTFNLSNGAYVELSGDLSDSKRGCGDAVRFYDDGLSSALVKNLLTQGLLDLANTSVSVYPSPLTGATPLTIELEGVNNASVKIVDLNGVVVYSSPVTSTTLKIEKEGLLKPGMYIVQVSSKNGVVNKKLIVR